MALGWGASDEAFALLLARQRREKWVFATFSRVLSFIDSMARKRRLFQYGLPRLRLATHRAPHVTSIGPHNMLAL